MPRKKATLSNEEQPSLLDVSARERTAICVPLIRQEVEQWRAQGQPGITPTTRRLLNWWFKCEHRTIRGNPFKYYDAQREAIETLIYLFEVKKIRQRFELLTSYARGKSITLPENDNFARYAFKMATGSGKTKVMALAMAWQYFNAVNGEGAAYATNFLLLAPNIIVLERLALDFAGGRVFQTDPIIPPDFKLLWDFDTYTRGDAERATSEGALYLTNIQQLYPREETTAPVNPIEALLGPAPPKNLQAGDNFLERIARRGACVVLNDEAHHTNDSATAWNKVIANLHQDLGERGLTAQLDFSATPRQPDGTLFTWTVYDYPLKQAIVDNVVKRPLKGVAHGISEVNSDKASVRYEPYLVAAVERWQEYLEQLEPLQKRPILFLMMGNTKEADDVAAWLRGKYPAHFADEKLLVIHTNQSGEISKKDLEQARATARMVDEGACPVNCIVSVLMLREGWDVNNVTVVAGLRPYSSKADILPEQAIGRGLRLMFRGQSGYRENVDIIGNNNFMKIVDDLEKEEGIKLDTFEYGKKKTPLIIPTIQVLTERIPAFDIAIPRLSPRVERKKDVRAIIEEIDMGKVNLRVPLTFDPNVKPPDSFTYEGRDVISNEVIVSREYTMPQAQTPGEIIAFYVQIIAGSLKLSAHFATLAPKVAQFLQDKAFGETVKLDSPPVLQALNQRHVLHLTEKVFLTLLRPILTEEKAPFVENTERLLSTTPPFPWSGKVVEVENTLFNLTPCGNEYEQEFARFLDRARDVVTFANVGNLTPNLSIEYLDGETNLRYYEPDFVAVDKNGVYWLLETKGREDPDVAYKNSRAETWCADVTELTGQEWRFQIVKQKDFYKLNPPTFTDLISGLTAGGLLFIEI
jgi:type III restriction enzyme